MRLTDAAELSGFLSEPDEIGRLLVERWTTCCPRAGTPARSQPHCCAARDVLVTSDDWSAEELEATCRAAAEALGWKAGDFFRPIRLAVTGKAVSPPLFGSIVLLGRERTLARLEGALDRLRAGTPA